MRPLIRPLPIRHALGILRILEEAKTAIRAEAIAEWEGVLRTHGPVDVDVDRLMDRLMLIY